MTGVIPRPRAVLPIETGDQPPIGAMFLCRVETDWQSRAVSVAQALTRDGSRFSHVGIHVGHGDIVHADQRTGRVVLENFRRRYGYREVLWSDAPIQRELADAARVLDGDVDPISLGQIYRERVAQAALALVDSPYGWAAYLAIAAEEWRWRTRHKLISYVDQRGQLTCSGLVARAYGMAGIDVTGGRRDTVVTPADLALLDEVWVRTRLAALESRIAAIEELLA